MGQLLEAGAEIRTASQVMDRIGLVQPAETPTAAPNGEWAEGPDSAGAPDLGL